MHGVGQITGWHATITPKQIWNAASGTVMCAYAINVGAGANASLGCNDLGVPAGASSHNPRGNLEQVTMHPGLTRLRGWAGDPDTNGPTRLRIYFDGYLVGSGVTKKPRPDVSAIGFGTNAGFDVTLPITQPQARPFPIREATPFGQVHVCIYAENGGALGTDNGTVGCAQPAPHGIRPAGAHDPIGVRDGPGGSGGEHGWAYDPDAAGGPITVTVRRYDLGSPARGFGQGTTGLPRPDVFAVHPEAGANSGYHVDSQYIPEAGVEPASSGVSAQVVGSTVWYYTCTYLKNVGPGRTATRFTGCVLEAAYLRA